MPITALDLQGVTPPVVGTCVREICRPGCMAHAALSHLRRSRGMLPLADTSITSPKNQQRRVITTFLLVLLRDQFDPETRFSADRAGIGLTVPVCRSRSAT